jgi:acetylornithine/succinyldiaminopimelate/putrescine aminotransferase
MCLPDSKGDPDPVSWGSGQGLSIFELHRPILPIPPNNLLSPASHLHPRPRLLPLGPRKSVKSLPRPPFSI